MYNSKFDPYFSKIKKAKLGSRVFSDFCLFVCFLFCCFLFWILYLFVCLFVFVFFVFVSCFCCCCFVVVLNCTCMDRFTKVTALLC